MDIEKAKRLLAKMNVLVDHTEDNLSLLEQDLLKNYALQLYELTGGSMNPTAAPVTETPAVQPKPMEERIIESPILQVIEEEAEAVKEDFIDQQEIQKVADIVEEIEIPEVEISPELPIEQPVTETAVEAEAAKAFETKVSQNGEGELAGLFEIKKADDLLAKLRDKPLSKVEHGMGINEKIFTINELFGGNKELFQNTLNALNDAESFDQAKDFLIKNVAKLQDWAAPEKVKKVEKFVQLVYRRFV